MSSRHFPHWITFRRPTESTADSGQVTRAFEDAFPRRAKVNKTGGVGDVDGQKRSAAGYTIELPYDSALSELDGIGWQVIWQDTEDTINVTSVDTDFVGRQRLTTITGTLDQA